ncbi:hypothetical protein PO124_32165 [Bacillus licheniformis]|nr:hypothetical protein [Bacillus licheniformis]
MSADMRQISTMSLRKYGRAEHHSNPRAQKHVPTSSACSCKSYNLEGQVEHGGHLRVVTIDRSGIQTHEIK